MAADSDIGIGDRVRVLQFGVGVPEAGRIGRVKSIDCVPDPDDRVEVLIDEEPTPVSVRVGNLHIGTKAGCWGLCRCYRRQRSCPTEPLLKGAPVRMQGLVNKAHLNGKQGIVNRDMECVERAVVELESWFGRRQYLRLRVDSELERENSMAGNALREAVRCCHAVKTAVSKATPRLADAAVVCLLAAVVAVPLYDTYQRQQLDMCPFSLREYLKPVDYCGRARYLHEWLPAAMEGRSSANDLDTTKQWLVRLTNDNELQLAPVKSPSGLGQRNLGINREYLSEALRFYSTYGVDARIAFSLDPCEGRDKQCAGYRHADQLGNKSWSGADWQEKVFYPEGNRNTLLGEIMFQADVAMKRHVQRMTPLPFFTYKTRERLQKVRELKWEQAGSVVRGRRFWFVLADEAVVLVNDGSGSGSDRGALLVPSVRLRVLARGHERNPVTGVTEDTETDADASENARNLWHHAYTQLVDEAGLEYVRSIPEVSELQKVSEALVLARYLIQNGRGPPPEGAAPNILQRVREKWQLHGRAGTGIDGECLPSEYPLLIPIERLTLCRESKDHVSRMMMYGGVNLGMGGRVPSYSMSWSSTSANNRGGSSGSSPSPSPSPSGSTGGNGGNGGNNNKQPNWEVILDLERLQRESERQPEQPYNNPYGPGVPEHDPVDLFGFWEWQTFRR